MMKRVLIMVTIALIATACSDDKQAGEAVAGAAPEASKTPEVAAPKLANINLCELVPAEAIASALGASVLKPSKRGDYGETQSCDYQIDPSGADNYEFVQIWLYPPVAFTDEASAMDTASGLGQKASIAAAPGYGDKSYALVNETEQQTIISVLVNGKAALNFKAETLDHAKSVATLGMEALQTVL